MKKLLTELLEQLKFDGKDYRTESFSSIQEAIEIELQKPDPEPTAWMWQSDKKHYERKFFEYELEAQLTKSQLQGEIYPLFKEKPLFPSIKQLIANAVRVDSWENEFGHVMAQEPGFGDDSKGNATLLLDEVVISKKLKQLLGRLNNE